MSISAEGSYTSTKRRVNPNTGETDAFALRAGIVSPPTGFEIMVWDNESRIAGIFGVIIFGTVKHPARAVR